MTESPHMARLPSGEMIPALGQGTHTMGRHPARHDTELAALRLGIELGMTVLDTAEIYEAGESEELVGEAIAGQRDAVFVVSKVHPSHGRHDAVVAACERSLRRLGTDRIDLYLLHWPLDEVPLAEETFTAFEELVETGKVRYWGVSNFAVPDLEQVDRFDSSSHLAANQILYNLLRRACEVDVVPWCRHRDVPIMAYSPLERGSFLQMEALSEVAARRGATSAQVALAWLLAQDNVVAIPKASSADHVLDNHGAERLELSDEDMTTLDEAFPLPSPLVSFELL